MGVKSRDDRAHEFLIAEYNNIAQAHFNTINTISAFFKHYLAIVSVSIAIIGSVIGVAAKIDPVVAKTICYGKLPSALLTVLWFVGLAVMVYIANLRLDALIYARTVNSIRNYFIGRSKQDIREILYSKVLPTQSHLPRYHEPRFFGWVVLTFGAIDSLYLSLGILLYDLCFSAFADLVSLMDDRAGGALVCFFISCFIHYFIYYRLTVYRERHYLKADKLGVDIDGVLNRHRQQFARMLNSKTGHTLDPDDITTIPVHEDKTKNISKAECLSVFNDVVYWTSMPESESASSTLRKLRNAFGLKIYIFTFRDWPASPSTKEKRVLEDRWRKYYTSRIAVAGLYFQFWYWVKFCIARRPLINSITKRWLDNKKIPYQRLVVEKGNEYAFDASMRSRNRFHWSRTENIKYFVEDDLSKAQKLAFVCELVFLIDHPYNQCAEQELPKNVIRVKDWDDLYTRIKDLI